MDINQLEFYNYILDVVDSKESEAIDIYNKYVSDINSGLRDRDYNYEEELILYLDGLQELVRYVKNQIYSI